MTRGGMPHKVVLINAMSHAVRLMSIAVTRRRRRISGGQAWASDKIIAPAPQAGSQTEIGPSAGIESGSSSVNLAIRSQIGLGVWNSPFHFCPLLDKANSM